MGLLLRTWFKGERVGEDEFGNRYYRAKSGGKSVSSLRPNNNRHRRWVIYKREKEASRVPPGWHAWLHYISDKLPNPTPLYPWRKPPKPNLSGTEKAWRREGSMWREPTEQKVGYRAWSPVGKNKAESPRQKEQGAKPNEK